VLGDDVSAGDEAALNVADDAGDVAVSFWGRGVLRGWKLRSRELRLRSIGENFRVGRGWALREESLRGSRSWHCEANCDHENAAAERKGTGLSNGGDLHAVTAARVH